MARKKKFLIQKRIEVWVEKEIAADSFDDAVAKMKTADIRSFVKLRPGACMIDQTEIEGRGVSEKW